MPFVMRRSWTESVVEKWMMLRAKALIWRGVRIYLFIGEWGDGKGRTHVEEAKV
jgi:hypothetical protein